MSCALKSKAVVMCAIRGDVGGRPESSSVLVAGFGDFLDDLGGLPVLAGQRDVGQDTMPVSLPCASTTGTRRIFAASISAVASLRLLSSRTVCTGPLIASEAVAFMVSRPSATMRTAMSRSVTTPTGMPLASTTGICPQSFSIIMRATSRSGRLGRAARGVGGHHRGHGRHGGLRQSGDDRALLRSRGSGAREPGGT